MHQLLREEFMKELRMGVCCFGFGSALVMAATTGLFRADPAAVAGRETAQSGGASEKRPADAKVQTDAALGRRVPNFVLGDPAGKQVGLADFHEKNFLVIAFISCQCPISNQYL